MCVLFLVFILFVCCVFYLLSCVYVWCFMFCDCVVRFCVCLWCVCVMCVYCEFGVRMWRVFVRGGCLM